MAVPTLSAVPIMDNFWPGLSPSFSHSASSCWAENNTHIQDRLAECCMWVLPGRQPTSSMGGTAAYPQPPGAAHLEQAALDAHDLLPLRRHARQAEQLHLEHGWRLLRVDFHILEHLPRRGGHGGQPLGGGPASRRQRRGQRHRRCQGRALCSESGTPSDAPRRAALRRGVRGQPGRREACPQRSPPCPT